MDKEGWIIILSVVAVLAIILIVAIVGSNQDWTPSYHTFTTEDGIRCLYLSDTGLSCDWRRGE